MKKVSILSVLVFASAVTALASDQFGVQAGASWSLASGGSQSDAIQSRSMNVASLMAYPFWNVTSAVPAIPFKLLVGPIGQYDFWGQQADAPSVGNTNLRGKGWLAGVGVSGEYEKFTGIFGVEFLGDYSVTNALSNGASSDYSSPLSLKFVVGYKVLPFLSVDANLQITHYSTSNVNGTAVDVSSDKLGQTSYGVGARYYFDF